MFRSWPSTASPSIIEEKRNEADLAEIPLADRRYAALQRVRPTGKDRLLIEEIGLLHPLLGAQIPHSDAIANAFDWEARGNRSMKSTAQVPSRCAPSMMRSRKASSCSARPEGTAMSKSTRPLSGAGQKKYFRDLFHSTDGVTPEAAEALTSTCEREIAQIRVCDCRSPIAAERQPRRRPKPTPRPSQHPKLLPQMPSTLRLQRRGRRDEGGPRGPRRKLEAIASAADLKALAKAQHVALPSGDVSIDELRAAIVEGALQRVANRKAAAS